MNSANGNSSAGAALLSDAPMTDPWPFFVDGAQQMGTPLTASQIEQFQRFTELLLTANRQFNLTAIRDLPGIVAKLHLDSLSLLGPIARAHKLDLASLRQRSLRAVDVGSGAGIPGIPLLLAWPALRLSLIESVQKKGVFLRQTLAVLGHEASVLIERAEITGQHPAHREGYDLVFARAVAEMTTLAELTLPLARLGGLVILPKGAKASDETEAARYAIDQLGGEMVEIATLAVPGVTETRTAVVLRKARPTPSIFPRGPGLPAKRPLFGKS